ncbi:Cof-type HAD-IIB family hydrolase [Vibrio sp.]|nr:Cof-type HAD-IIB family hydrolase [Vibrio sp.]
MYKLIALDMDGTLLNSNKEISTRTKEAIAAAREKGKKVVLASGRPLQGMQAKLDELRITGQDEFVLFYNGSMVKELGSGEIIHQKIIDGKAAKLVADLAKKLGLYVHAFSPEYGLITPENNPYTKIEAQINTVAINIKDFSTLTDDEPIIKAMIVGAPEDITKAATLIPKEFHESYTVVQSAPIFLEFLNPNSHKGVGIEAIVKHLGYDASEVIAMGDAGNDNHMIQYAGLGVAMANAMEETKAIADLITDSNDDDGVAKIIEEYMLK